MNIHPLAKILTPNFKKHPKHHAFFIITLIALNLFAAGTLTQAQVSNSSSATPAGAVSALHTDGTYILDVNDNSVYLCGMGLAGFAPNLILWDQDATDSWSSQWNTHPQDTMEQTFQTLRDQWHINYIRVFIYPSWYYRDNIIPAQEDPASYSAQTTPISTKAYLHTLIQTADKYGLYVDLVPYMLTPSASSFGGDPYASPGYGWQGLPMEGWDEPAQRFLTDAGYSGSRELDFWNWFWTDMAHNYKNYKNVIFEAWNEPNLGPDNDAIPQGYMQYLKTMYSAIRTTGATNLIMMQWHMGWHPNTWGNDLSWTKQITTAIPQTTNLVFTTHLYYYAPTDLTAYWKTDYDGLKTQLSEAIKTMGVNAPLVINEQGSCLTKSNNKQNDYTWWQNLLKAQNDLNIGAGAYYWLSDTGLGPIYSGETMLTNHYTPNTMGQTYINTNHNNKTPTTPTPTPTTTNSAETPKQPTPSTPTLNTTQPTPQSTQLIIPTMPSLLPQPTPTAAVIPQPTSSTTPQPTPTSSSAVSTALANPIQGLIWGYLYRHWLILYWPQNNAWYISRW